MKNELYYLKGYLWSRFASGKQSELFDDVNTYCMFIGHGRSGHSLYGALLNAHPEAVIAHELDALLFVKHGISREQLYALILKRDRWFVDRGSRWHNFNYEVPNQWQGRFQKLKVIGDKKGGLSTLRLKRNPELLPRLRRIVQVPLRIVYIVRNPFDNISSMQRANREPLERNITGYFEMADDTARLFHMCEASETITLRHEDFVAQPKENMKRLVEFVGLTADERFLSDCSALVFPSPVKSRQRVNWPKESITAVQSKIDQHAFLCGYNFEN